MKTRGNLLTIIIAISGCATTRADSAAPVEMPETDALQTSEADSPAPTEVGFSYVSSDDEVDSDDDAESEDEAAQENEEATEVEDAFTPPDVLRRVEAALDERVDPYAPRLISPPLPVQWPSTTQEVMYIVYPLQPLERGVTRYTVSQPSHRIVVSLTERSISVEELQTSSKKKVGELSMGRDRTKNPLRGAEVKLFDVLEGRTSASRARYRLHDYQQWLERHPDVAKDLAARAPEFIEYVRSPS